VENNVHIGLTGGEGRLGVAIRQASNAAGFMVTYTSRSATKPTGAGLDLLQLPTTEELDSIFQKCDVLVHCAAKMDRSRNVVLTEIFAVNVASTVALASYALSRGISFIYISGAAVYSNPHARLITELDNKGFNKFSGEYGYTKFLAEEALQPLIRAGLECSILRPSSIYGGIDSSNGLISRMLVQAATTGLVSVRPPIQDSIGLVHRKDVANSVLHILSNGISGTYNVSSGHVTTLNTLADLIGDIMCASKEISEEETVGTIPKVTFDLDINLLRETGWRPEVSLDQGLREMVRPLLPFPE
jgi:UDP-glucose 4-epimerase